MLDKIKKYARIYRRNKEGSINIFSLYGKEGWTICYHSWHIVNTWNVRNLHDTDNKFANKARRRRHREDIRYHIKRLREALEESQINL